MSFLPQWTPVIFPSDLVFDHEITDYCNDNLFLDGLAPTISNADIYVYFVKLNNFYSFEFPSYKDYLADYTIRLGNVFRLSVEQSHYQILMSTLKKLYILNYANEDLDQLDFFILDWAKSEISINDFNACRDYVLFNPKDVHIIKYYKGF